MENDSECPNQDALLTSTIKLFLFKQTKNTNKIFETNNFWTAWKDPFFLFKNMSDFSTFINSSFPNRIHINKVFYKSFTYHSVKQIKYNRTEYRQSPFNILQIHCLFSITLITHAFHIKVINCNWKQIYYLSFILYLTLKDIDTYSIYLSERDSEFDTLLGRNRSIKNHQSLLSFAIRFILNGRMEHMYVLCMWIW